MSLYRCRVRDGSGRTERLLREAGSRESVLRELSSPDRYVLSVRELPRRGPATRRWRRLSRGVVLELTDLLSLTLGSGLSLRDSLEIAGTVFARGPGKELAEALARRIRSGEAFHVALEGLGGSFPPVYRGLVKVGERVGTLGAVLAQLSAYLREEKRLRERIGTASIYPLIVIGVGLSGVALVLAVVLPRMRTLFASLGEAARVDRLASALVVSVGSCVGVAAVIAALALLIPADRRRGGKVSAAVDRLLLRVPGPARLLVSREMLVLSFAMETLSSAGVRVEEALEEAAGATGNTALRAAILASRQGVMRGEQLSACLGSSGLFPPRLAVWVGIGERVGQVERVFRQLRLYYQQEVEKWTQRLASVIEPALIVFLGILILLFAVLFVAPLFDLYGSLL